MPTIPIWRLEFEFHPFSPSTPRHALIKGFTCSSYVTCERILSNKCSDEWNRPRSRGQRLRRQFSSKNYVDVFEVLPPLDLPEPESLDDAEDAAFEEEEEESEADAAGLLLPESDLPSEAAAETSVLPSDLLAESDDFAGLLPDLA